MARKPRIESSDGLYHVINRGNYRSSIFESEGARLGFERTLFEACERFGWRLQAYCLMSNHFHLSVATPIGNLSEGMAWLQGTYAKRFNGYRDVVGHLFQGRFKSLAVEPGMHLKNLVDYIHLNPVRAGLASTESLKHYRWTSLWYFPDRRKRPEFLDSDWMDCCEGLTDTGPGWRRYLRELVSKADIDTGELRKTDQHMCRGWCIGGADFKKALARDLVEREGELRMDQEALSQFNRVRWQMGLEKCLMSLRLVGIDPVSSINSAPWKLAIASKLKRECSVSNAWLTQKLAMGVPKAVSAQVGRYRRQAESSCKFASKLRKLNIER